MKILLMGATGTAGTQAIKALQAKGIRPTAAVRDIAKAKTLLGEDLDFVQFDYTKPETFAPTLKGVDKLFMIAPPGSKDPAIVREICKVAKDEGVKSLLFQSGRTSGSYPGKPLYEIEQDLNKGDLPNTIIRPAWYMQNFHTWTGTTLSDDEICLPTGDAKVSMIDLKDLGAAIAEILSTEGHEGKRYNLTGSEALDHGQVADILTEVKGRPVAYRDLSHDAYVAKMVEKGWDEKAAVYCLWLFDRVKEGSEEAVSNDFQTIVGRQQRSFKQFAQDELNA